MELALLSTQRYSRHSRALPGLAALLGLSWGEPGHHSIPELVTPPASQGKALGSAGGALLFLGSPGGNPQAGNELPSIVPAMNSSSKRLWRYNHAVRQHEESQTNEEQKNKDPCDREKSSPCSCSPPNQAKQQCLSPCRRLWKQLCQVITRGSSCAWLGLCPCPVSLGLALSAQPWVPWGPAR